MRSLTIICPVHHDSIEANLTVRSIRETAGDRVAIIVIDDCSPNALILEDKSVTLIKLRHRVGGGAARHLGIEMAHTPYCLLCDSHMRFEPGWLEVAEEAFKSHSWQTVFCAVCRGFTSKTAPFGKPDGEYYGANFDFNKFDGVWAQERENDAELPCLMGASYFVRREWYLALGGLQFMRGWGSEEICLSLKTWLAGGEIRLMKNVHLWHRFRVEKLPYTIFTWQVIYNKLFLIHTILPLDVGQRLISAMPRGNDFNQAAMQIKADWGLIVTERARNQRLFTRDFDWLVNKFGITI